MLIIDVANVIGSRPNGWWRDRAGSTARLVAQLRGAVRTGRLCSPVVAVVEGAGRLGPPPGTADGVEVVHAARAGDDAIVGRVRHEPGPVVVVSADRGLRARVERNGAGVRGPTWLWSRLGGNEP